MKNSLIRHFTATAFVIHRNSVALHWHPKIDAWLPPGGHIEPNEDPVQTVLREVYEETGLLVSVVPTSPIIDLAYPKQVLPPFTIEIEDINDPVEGPHQHIDMIYICRPINYEPIVNNAWLWVSRDEVNNSTPLDPGTGENIPPPKDVLILAKHAFNVVDSL